MRLAYEGSDRTVNVLLIAVPLCDRYEDLELFKELEPSDLDYLGIGNTEHRAKILAAVQLLHDLDCKLTCWDSPSIVQCRVVESYVAYPVC